MSNTCFATYKVTGSKESVTKLHSTIKELDEKEKALVDNDWYNPNLWLGCLVKALGGEPDNVNCRGYITSYKLDQDVLTLTTETAWVEMAETRHFLESCFPSMKIYFIEEEYGEEIFRTNDIDGRFFKDRYYLDASEGSSYFETLAEVAEYVSWRQKEVATFIVSGVNAKLHKSKNVRELCENLRELRSVACV